jgi:RNA polymerase sigma-70 factor (ECF subfamily)
MIAPDAFDTSELVTELPRLRRYARVLAGGVSGADGLVMDTLVRARNGAARRAMRASARTWLFALMHETHAGRRARFVRGPAPPVAGDAPATASVVPERQWQVLTHFGGLPLDEREVLFLVAVEGMAYEEIADLLRVPLATVIARLKRARDLVRSTDATASHGSRPWGNDHVPEKAPGRE